MSTLVNHAIFLQAPKGVIPDLAAEGKTPGALNRIGQFFQACAGGMHPGLVGDTKIRVAKGSSNAALAPAQVKLTLASVTAAHVFDINGVPFTALSGTPTSGNNEFDISGTDAAAGTSLAAAITACVTAGVAGQVQAGNLAGTIQCTSVAAGDAVQVGDRFYTARSYATGVIGDFSIAGNDTADAAALAAALNADPAFSAVAYAESSTDTVTVRQRSGTTGLKVRTTAATFTLGGLSSGKLAAVAVVLITSLFFGVFGNSLTVKTKGIAATGTVTYVAPSGTQTIVINGVTVYNATAGASATLTAAAAAAAINASTATGILGLVRAVSRAGVVHIFAVDGGLLGNATTLSVTGTGATASVARLAGGTVATEEGVQASGTNTISGGSGTINTVINGVTIGVAFNTSDTQTATDIAAAINSSTNALVRGHVYASSAAGVVTITAIRGGVRGNYITLSASGTGATASGTRLANGAAPTTIVPATPRLAGGVGGDSTAPITWSF